eukprot:gb/GEZJ01000164.1/.p1 GENE.gb/GEZJ01000164.1/~~gb/GEZJ01000164.1/.p1  ORF type:complete len:566 (+),score=88.01 gb/GEZJ01000164.1/:142-1698(+)
MQNQRYSRLVALNDTSLHMALDTLSISRSVASLPPRKRPTKSPDVFSPFNYPPPSSTIEIEQPSLFLTPLSKEVVTALFNAARSEHSSLPPRAKHKLLRRENGAINQAAPEAPKIDPLSAPPRKLLARRVSHPLLKSYGSNTTSTSTFRTARSRLGLKRRPSELSSSLRDLAHQLQSVDNLRAKRSRLLGGQEKPQDIPDVPGAEPRFVELVTQEMLEKSPNVQWDDIAGLDFAKTCVKEAVIWPMQRPDIFVGLRGPPKGLLLFGPPGTGKTMIGKAIASQSKAKFFNISASSLMSKWIGDAEKTVRALFLTARAMQPSVVFVDEIDSILTSRNENEHESSRRLKTEFLVQMDGAGTSREDRVLVVGATNRPQELDEAARRRLVKRLYIPLPDMSARKSLVRRLLEKQQGNDVREDEIEQVAKITDGYSGSDLYALCAEASLGPVRELGDKIGSVEASSVRAIRISDFEYASRVVRASVGKHELSGYVNWNKTYGSFSAGENGKNGPGMESVNDMYI